MSTNWQVSFQQAMRLRNKARKTITIKKNLSDLLVCHSSSLYSAAKDQSVSWLSVKVMNIIPSTASYHIYFSFKSVFSAYLPFSLSPVFPSPLSLRFSFPFFLSFISSYLSLLLIPSLSQPTFCIFLPRRFAFLPLLSLSLGILLPGCPLLKFSLLAFPSHPQAEYIRETFSLFHVFKLPVGMMYTTKLACQEIEGRDCQHANEIKRNQQREQY